MNLPSSVRGNSENIGSFLASVGLGENIVITVHGVSSIVDPTGDHFVRYINV